LQPAVGVDRVTDRMLHERIRGDNEVAGQPAAEQQRERGDGMAAPPQTPLAEHEQAEERRFEEEGEHAFHRQRLPDDAAGDLREARPVRAELKLHRQAGDDADGEVDAEDPNPEPRRVVPLRAPGAERCSLHDDDEQRQSECQLRKQIVVDDGEGELHPVPEQGI
jgi:hypothetical protein